MEMYELNPKKSTHREIEKLMDSHLIKKIFISDWGYGYTNSYQVHEDCLGLFHRKWIPILYEKSRDKKINNILGE